MTRPALRERDPVAAPATLACPWCAPRGLADLMQVRAQGVRYGCRSCGCRFTLARAFMTARDGADAGLDLEVPEVPEDPLDARIAGALRHDC